MTAVRLSMLLRREEEAICQLLLTRLDLAIGKALNEGIRTDEVNSISQQFISIKKLPPVHL
jgi:hypothetical protein